MSGERRPASEVGATLIEVVVAMLLLAILALTMHQLTFPALALVSQGGRESNATAIANAQLESTIMRIWCGDPCGGEPLDSAWALTEADSIFRTVVSDGMLYTIDITVRRTSTPAGLPRAVTVTGNVYYTQ